MVGRKEKTSFKRMVLLEEKLFHKLTKDNSNRDSAQSNPNLDNAAAPGVSSSSIDPLMSEDGNGGGDRVHANDILVTENPQDIPLPPSPSPPEDRTKRDVTDPAPIQPPPPPPPPPPPKLVLQDNPQATNTMTDLERPAPAPPAAPSAAPSEAAPGAGVGASPAAAATAPLSSDPTGLVSTQPRLEDTCQSTCKICGDEISNLTSLNEHYQQAHDEAKIVENQCRVCELYFPTKAALKRHIDKYHTQTSFNSRKRKFKQVVDIGDIGDDDDDDDDYDYDGNNDDNKVEDTEIESLAAPKPPKIAKRRNKSSTLFCPKCNKQYKLQWRLNKHMKSAHGEGGSNVDSGDGAGGGARSGAVGVGDDDDGIDSIFKERPSNKRKILVASQDELNNKKRLRF